MSTQPVKTKIAFISSDTSLNMLLKGRPYNMSSEDPHFKETLEMVKGGASEDEVLNFVEKEVNKIKAALQVLDGTDVSISDGIVRYQGEVLHNSLTNKMIDMLQEGFDMGPMARFLQNLMQNPSKRAVDELYGFLEKGELPITPDGHFLAYKAVRRDFKDIHSGTFDNSVGQVCKMARNKVDDDKNRTCSHGLHFCSVEYLKHFANRDGHVMILKINPRDVVSIPADYNDTKGRCSEYKVIGEYTDFDYGAPDTPAWNSSVVDDEEYYEVSGQNYDWTVSGGNGSYNMDPN